MTTVPVDATILRAWVDSRRQPPSEVSATSVIALYDEAVAKLAALDPPTPTPRYEVRRTAEGWGVYMDATGLTAHFAKRHILGDGENPWPLVEYVNEIALSESLDGVAVEVEVEFAEDGIVHVTGIWRHKGDREPGVLFHLCDGDTDALIVGTFVGNVKRIVVIA